MYLILFLHQNASCYTLFTFFRCGVQRWESKLFVICISFSLFVLITCFQTSGDSTKYFPMLSMVIISYEMRFKITHCRSIVVVVFVCRFGCYVIALNIIRVVIWWCLSAVRIRFKNRIEKNKSNPMKMMFNLTYNMWNAWNTSHNKTEKICVFVLRFVRLNLDSVKWHSIPSLCMYFTI